MATLHTHSDKNRGSRFSQADYDAYWREHYRDEPYYKSAHEWDDYEPAYRYGYESYSARRGRNWDSIERDLESGWERAKGRSRLAWNDAKQAVRAGWNHVERMLPGDADGDGR